MKVAKVIRDYPIPGPANHWFKAGDTLTRKIAQNIFENDENFEIAEAEVKRHPHFFEITEVPDGPWKPKDGERYFTIHSDGIVIEAIYNDSPASFEFRRFACGNGFQTREEVESKLPAVRAALTGKSLKEVLDGHKLHIERQFWQRDAGRVSSTQAAEQIVTDILAVWEARNAK